MTTLMHYENNHEQFGWLLNDVPKSCMGNLSGKSTDNKLVNNVYQEERNKSKATHLLQLDSSKTQNPHRRRQCLAKNSPVLTSTWPSPRLCHTIEVDEDYRMEEPKYTFFKIATALDNKLEDMSFQTSNLQKQTRNLKQAYEELDETTNQLLLDVRHLIAELQKTRNIEDLIRLLDGKTERISSKKWPFVMARSLPLNNLNLII